MAYSRSARSALLIATRVVPCILHTDVRKTNTTNSRAYCHCLRNSSAGEIYGSPSINPAITMIVTSSIIAIKAFKNPPLSFDCGKNLVMLSSMPSLDMATDHRGGGYGCGCQPDVLGRSDFDLQGARTRS